MLQDSCNEKILFGFAVLHIPFSRVGGRFSYWADGQIKWIDGQDVSYWSDGQMKSIGKEIPER